MFLSIAVLMLSLAAGAVFAQTAPDYDAWESLASRAETAIVEDRASDAALEDLRSQIAGFRDRFLTAQDQNAERISTLESQLSALGPAPEDAPEAEEIAARRAVLSEQLAELRAPVLKAEEAYTRADGLIGEIDNVIRTRQADALFRLGPMPINPALWPGAIADLSASTRALWSEVRQAWQSPVRQADLRNNLPMVLGLLAVAIVLLLRGRQWVLQLVERLRQRTRPGTGVWSVLASVGQILLPLAGIFLLTEALAATGMVGMRGALLLDRLPIWAGVLLFVRWLAEQTFTRSLVATSAIPLLMARRAEARFYANVLAVMLVLRGLQLSLTEFDGYSDATVAVLEFPILLICSLTLFRLGQILRAAQFEDGEGLSKGLDGAKFRLGLARNLGLLALAVSITAPILTAVGYARAGEFLVYPTILTMSVAALLVLLQRFCNDLFELITGTTVAEANSLIPVLVSFTLTLASLPVFALIWGARVADLTELWTRFQEGFVLGETRISPSDFVAFAVVFAALYAITRLLQGGLRTSVLPKTRIDVGGQNAIVSGVGYLGIFLAALVAITTAGIDLSSLAILAGALSVGIGFGLQNIVSNFVSGIILLIERPISEGDWIEVGPNMGTVRDISVRSTRIETFDRTDVIIPNADLITGTVTNYTRGNTLGRVIVSVGVAYGTDTRKVEGILLSIARAHPLVMMNPEPFIYFKGFGADSLDFEIRAILSDVLQIITVQSEMHHEIARRFQEEGIEIPFAQRDIWLRNPEVLSGANKTTGDDRGTPVATVTDSRSAGMNANAGDTPEGDT